MSRHSATRYYARPFYVIGPETRIDPHMVARRVSEELERLGSLMLIRHKGVVAAVVPNNRMAQRAEAAGPASIIGTYTLMGHDRQQIAADLRAACGGAKA